MQLTSRSFDPDLVRAAARTPSIRLKLALNSLLQCVSRGKLRLIVDITAQYENLAAERRAKERTPNALPKASLSGPTGTQSPTASQHEGVPKPTAPAKALPPNWIGNVVLTAIALPTLLAGDPPMRQLDDPPSARYYDDYTCILDDTPFDHHQGYDCD